MEMIQNQWYAWLAYIAFVITLLTTFGIFIDAARKNEDAVAWKMLTVIATVLVLPSVPLSIVRDWQDTLRAALTPLAILGIGATVLALIAVILYALGVGGGLRCANCHKPRDPSWPYCPFCEYDKPAALSTQPQPIAYPNTPIAPIEPFASTQAPTQALPAAVPGSFAPGAEARGGETINLSAAPDTVNLSASESGGVAPRAGETRLLRAQPSFLAYLVVQSGPHQGKSFQLSDTTSIGRQADQNDIVLDDDSVSRQHAKVKFEDGKFVITDLASSNGTFIQDKSGEWKKIQQRALTDGTTLRIGETIFNFMEIKQKDAKG